MEEASCMTLTAFFSFHQAVFQILYNRFINLPYWREYCSWHLGMWKTKNPGYVAMPVRDSFIVCLWSYKVKTHKHLTNVLQSFWVGSSKTGMINQ